MPSQDFIQSHRRRPVARSNRWLKVVYYNVHFKHITFDVVRALVYNMVPNALSGTRPTALPKLSTTRGPHGMTLRNG